MKIITFLLLNLLNITLSCNNINNKITCFKEDYCKWRNNKCKTSDVKQTRTLFIGNSFTIRNDLNKMFKQLAIAKGENPVIGLVAGGSFTFNKHSQSDVTKNTINLLKWDNIVLQEQSFFLTDQVLKRRSIESAKILYDISKNNTKNIILFETWGYLNGRNFYDYYEMQDRLKEGYEDVKNALIKTNDNDPDVKIAYVGESFRFLYPKYKEELYTWDGRHPSLMTSYLAACSIFSVAYEDYPSNYRPNGIDKDLNLEIQDKSVIVFIDSMF